MGILAQVRTCRPLPYQILLANAFVRLFRPAPVDRRKSLARWFQEGYDTPRDFEGCNGLGLSIWPRSERAMHRGYPLFNPAQTALQALGVHPASIVICCTVFIERNAFLLLFVFRSLA